jgi:hypothetical protein
MRKYKYILFIIFWGVVDVIINIKKASERTDGDTGF